MKILSSILLVCLLISAGIYAKNNHIKEVTPMNSLFDPCPFEHPETEEGRNPLVVQDLSRGDYRVHCPVCGAHGPKSDTVEGALAGWNGRLDFDIPQSDAERLTAQAFIVDQAILLVNGTEQAADLAKCIAERLYPEGGPFEPLDNLAGILSQIDNMTFDLVPPKIEADPGGTDADIMSRALQAFLLTRDYLGESVLPCTDGWAWYEACKAIAERIPDDLWSGEFHKRVEVAMATSDVLPEPFNTEGMYYIEHVEDEVRSEIVRLTRVRRLRGYQGEGPTDTPHRHLG